MSKIEEKINKASDTYGRTRLNRCMLKDRQMPQFDAYDIENAFEQGAKWDVVTYPFRTSDGRGEE